MTRFSCPYRNYIENLIYLIILWFLDRYRYQAKHHSHYQYRPYNEEVRDTTCDAVQAAAVLPSRQSLLTNDSSQVHPRHVDDFRRSTRVPFDSYRSVRSSCDGGCGSEIVYEEDCDCARKDLHTQSCLRPHHGRTKYPKTPCCRSIIITNDGTGKGKVAGER